MPSKSQSRDAKEMPRSVSSGLSGQFCPDLSYFLAFSQMGSEGKPAAFFPCSVCSFDSELYLLAPFTSVKFTSALTVLKDHGAGHPSL